jgi:hypothetical protein
MTIPACAKKPSDRMDAIDIKRAENSHIWQREEAEHYVEPEWCSRRLFEEEKFDGAIWDPACGFGRIPEAARARGHIIVYSDICDRGYDPHGLKVIRDFFESGDKRVENIVSNPPFDIFQKFATRALALANNKVALIWLVRTLPAARWLQDTPLARVLLLTPRPSMPPGHVITRGEKPGGGKQDFCWLIWDHTHGGPASIGWLHRDAALVPSDGTK